jgi:hypothetical protein
LQPPCQAEFSIALGKKTVAGVAITGMKQVFIFITPVTMNFALRERLKNSAPRPPFAIG